jgi:glycopeptide antibiotics resistance protein/DNA-binding XRE family transcriptional regulator
MDLKKIADFLKKRRKEIGLTQEELANKLYVTEKAISRWETGRGTPDISLLIPLSKELNVDISEILNGESRKKHNDVEQLIEYNKINKKTKYGLSFKFTILFYVLSILIYLIYLRFEYDPRIELNYFIRLFSIFISSLFIIIGNKIYSNYYVEKIEDKNRMIKLSQIIVFVYYCIFMFNMTIFARYNSSYGYNLVPFKSISNLFINGSIYNIIINFFGNLVIFMPLEYFVIELLNKRKFVLNLIISSLIIILIEIIQYLFKIGVFDIDDIILSLFGMMMFYFIYTKTIIKNNLN